MKHIFPIALVGAFLVIGIAAYLKYAPTTSTTSYTVATTTTATSTETATTPGMYTLADVAQHSGSSSCWTTINGNVYDLTSWISEHPGGEGPILSICGRDGTQAFDGQHGSDPRAQGMLATFKIGVLTS
jgi:cytochrome b involved in lipid metabolism